MTCKDGEHSYKKMKDETSGMNMLFCRKCGDIKHIPGYYDGPNPYGVNYKK